MTRTMHALLIGRVITRTIEASSICRVMTRIVVALSTARRVTRTIEASSVCRVIQIGMSVDGSSMTRTMLAHAAWESNTEATRVCQGIFAQRSSIKTNKFS